MYREHSDEALITNNYYEVHNCHFSIKIHTHVYNYVAGSSKNQKNAHFIKLSFLQINIAHLYNQHILVYTIVHTHVSVTITALSFPRPECY